MDDSEKRVWGIHTRDASLFLKHGRIAIGWGEMGDLSQIAPDRDSFRKKYVETYPNNKPRAVSINVGQMYRFCHEAKVDDYIVFPSREDRQIHIGKITGNYVYDVSHPEFVQARSAEWLKHLPRTKFTQGALYESSSAMTFFAIKNYADEFLSALSGNAQSVEIEDDTVGATTDEIIEGTKDFVLKELSRNLKGFALEEFVANLLQAMGYRTTVSPQGGDRGIDITAYKDELPPRILVQVKSQDGDIKESTIQSLKGAMREGDYGLFVTLSNYTKNARKYLESTPIIRGINGAELADLILKYYRELDSQYQSMIPLKMAYLPAPKAPKEE